MAKSRSKTRSATGAKSPKNAAAKPAVEKTAEQELSADELDAVLGGMLACNTIGGAVN